MRTPVVYIGGTGRSGSTLLERMLATVPGACPVGELVFIWERGLRRNDRCGCGERFRDCSFWSSVGDKAFGGWDHVDLDDAIRLRRVVDRHRNLPRLSGLRGLGGLQAEVQRYCDLTDRLYLAIAEVSEASVIIDSSKHFTYASVLRRLPAVDLRVVHLVRQCHGVVYSWSKSVVKPDVGDGSTHMSLHSTPWAVSLWLAENLLYEMLLRGGVRGARLRYEDLAAQPAEELGRVLTELQLAGSAEPLAEPREVGVPPSHALSGNPMRFRSGPLVLRADEEWRLKMPRRRKAAVSLATWPLLMHYGYMTSLRKGPRGKSRHPMRLIREGRHF